MPKSSLKVCRCGKQFEPINYPGKSIKTNKCVDCLVKKGKEKVHKEVKTKVRNETPVLKKSLERIVNAICRLIDTGCNCISCTSKGDQAGHRHSVAANGTLRYNLHNLHLQEDSCNDSKGGNPTKYDEGLERVYGISYREYVSYQIVKDYPFISWRKDNLQDAIVKARAYKKELEKYLLTVNTPLVPEERIRLRNEANKAIGIY